MTPESRTLEVRGLRLHYRDWGGAGQPLILLHGLASNSRWWDLTAPLLTRLGRVLALDQRGHGASDKPEDGYGFESVAADVADFVGALGLERPGLIGHSWGANVALQFAADRPDAVAWLVLVDGGFLEISAFPDMTWERTLEMMSPPPLAGMKLAAFLQGARNWPGLSDIWSDDVEQIVLANFHISEEETISPRLSRENHLKILRSLWEQKPSELWSRVNSPTLLIPTRQRHGDGRSALWMEQKKKAIALAEEHGAAVRVEWMEDTSHDAPLQRPRELVSAIERFLGELG